MTNDEKYLIQQLNYNLDNIAKILQAMNSQLVKIELAIKIK